MHSASLQTYPVKVSIVLPTFNQSQFLAGAIQSIMNQTFQDFELIIINDGSTDQTAALLATLKHPKVRSITQNNQGLPNALNNGFEMARGEFFTWTSTDNIVGPTWLEELVKALETSPKDVDYAFSYYAVMDNNEKIQFVNRDVRFDLPTLLTRHTGNASFLYRSALAKKVGTYDPTLVYAEDLDMWIRMATQTRATLVESVLYYYRQHDNSMTFQREKVKNATRAVVTKFLAKTGGKFDIDQLYPSIHLSDDPVTERWKARVRLVSACANATYYCPTDAAIHQLTLALQENYDRGLVGNLVHLFAKENRWHEAADCVATYQQRDPAEFFHTLMQIISAQDKNALQNIPFLTLDEKFMATDCKGPWSQEQLLRHLACAIPHAQDRVLQSFEKLVTDLVNQLEDCKDHPEIWQNISAMRSPEEKKTLQHLKNYLTQLTRLPQDAKALLLLQVLEAVCDAYTHNTELAKTTLQSLKTQHPDLPVIHGALAFVTQDETLLTPSIAPGV